MVAAVIELNVVVTESFYLMLLIILMNTLTILMAVKHAFDLRAAGFLLFSFMYLKVFVVDVGILENISIRLKRLQGLFFYLTFFIVFP